MKILSRTTDQLGALGGKPIFDPPLHTAWPPVDKPTERALAEVYRSRNHSFNGPWEQRFCRDFAKAQTAGHAVFMANGTVTLEAALHVLGVGPGDEVIVPGLTWVATAMAAIYVGAKPVFVDVEPDTLCLDPKKVEEAITPRTKAIIPVHLYGGMADMDRIMALARKHRLKVIEDCAHAHGGRWNDRGVGSIGDMGSFSFQQSKTMASGEGGAVITSDPRLAERLFLFKHIGYDMRARQGKASSPPPSGLICHNYRGTEFQAAILCGQLKNLKAMTARRNRNADFLTRELEKIPGIKIQARGRKATQQGYYAFMVTLDLAQWRGATKEEIAHGLYFEGLPTMSTYGTVYRHILWNVPPSAYRIHGGYRDQRGPGCKISEEVGSRRTLGFFHYHLDQPRPILQKIVDVFAKVHRHAAELRGAKK